MTAFVAPDQFKSYDDLKKRLDYVLGNKNTNRPTPVQEETEYDSYAEAEPKRVTEEQVMQKLEESYQASKTVNNTADEEDDPMSYFAKLAES